MVQRVGPVKAEATLTKLSPASRDYLELFAAGRTRWRDIRPSCRAALKQSFCVTESREGDWYVTDHGKAVLNLIKGETHD